MSRDLKPTCPITTRFLDDLKLSGKEPRTQQAYVRAVPKFAEFLGHSPDLATEDRLRNYLLHLAESKKWASSTINVAQQALKLFFRITCPKDRPVLKLARVKTEQKLPVVISVDEVHTLLKLIEKPSMRCCFKQFKWDNRGISTHTLRHCCVTHLLEAGVSLRLIQKYLGHKHLTSTLIYLHITTVGEEAAIAKIHSPMKQNPSTVSSRMKKS